MSFALVPGARIADRYELRQQIGEGGMGAVWNARHLALDAPVAIKFVRMEGNEPERFHARFQREAKLAASVRHRNVVSITDYGYLPDGSAYMVMDYLEGEAFSHYLRVRPPTAELVYLMEQTTRGLVAVHDIGIVHRDLKPENIFLVRDATGVYPKLIDFGISKHLRPGPEGERRSAVTTTDGAIVGTPVYMSPEQARGLHDIDQRTDIYSMGVILYEALSGRLPYDSPYMGDLILAIVMGGAPPLHEVRPDLDRRLCDVVMKAMAQDASARYQTARELLAALAAVASNGEKPLRSERPPSNMELRPVVMPTPESTTTPLGDAGIVQEFRLTGNGDVVPASLSDRVPMQRMLPSQAALTRLAVGSGVIALLFGGVWLGMQNKNAEPLPSVTPLEAPAAASTDVGAPGSQAPQPLAQPVTIELTGLPEHAQITLDGRSVTGTRFQLAKDDSQHELMVTAEGFAPWKRRFVANDDASVDVLLTPLTPEPTTPVAEPKPKPKPTPRPDVAAKPVRPKQERDRPKRVITELDY